MLRELDPEKVCYLIVKLREFGIQATPNLGGGSDAVDDGFAAVYTNSGETSVRHEAEGLIEAMNVDEQRELIALALVGRGDYAKEEWTDALSAAASHPEPTTTAFLLQDPLVTSTLADGLAAFGHTCVDNPIDR